MKLNRIEIVNFCGLKGLHVINIPHIVALIGANGVGKSTIINAIRYGLTGIKSVPDIINKEASETTVEIFLNDADGNEISFSRTESRTKPSKFKVCGSATTQKALNSYIEDVCGVDVDKIRIASSSEIVANMKPQEFASFILRYIPEKMTAEEVLSLIPDSTLEMMTIGEALLPAENICLEDLDEVDSVIRAQRKELKSLIQVEEANYESKVKEKPAMPKEAIKAEMEDILASENKKKMYEAAMSAYKKAKEDFDKRIKVIKNIESQIKEITTSKPDELKLKELKDKSNSLKETMRNHDKSLYGLNNSLSQLKITLDALEKPICPISPLITCHENKAVAIEDISGTIKATEEGIMALEVEKKKVEEQINVAESEIADFEKDKSLYERKVFLMSQLKTLKDTVPEEPKLPEKVEIVDVETRKFQLNEYLKTWESYEEGINLLTQIERNKAELATFEALVKAFAEKGPVRQGILTKYLKVFEDICNERSNKIRPEIKFSFRSEDGIVVYMDNGKGIFLPYENLSGGEKAYFMFIIMDMLNQLCGVNILLLDELSVIDNEIFSKYVEIILEHKDDYDHIIMCAVNHPDTVETLKCRDIPIVNLTSK